MPRLPLFAILLVATGCSAQTRFPVQGMVTFQDKAVDGVIRFLATGPNAGPVGGASIVAGRYDIPADKGLEPGIYKVILSWPGGPGERTPEQVAAGASTPAKELLPEKYTSPQNTVLQAEIKSTRENRIDFHLK